MEEFDDGNAEFFIQSPVFFVAYGVQQDGEDAVIDSATKLHTVRMKDGRELVVIFTDDDVAERFVDRIENSGTLIYIDDEIEFKKFLRLLAGKTIAIDPDSRQKRIALAISADELLAGYDQRGSAGG